MAFIGSTVPEDMINASDLSNAHGGGSCAIPNNEVSHNQTGYHDGKRSMMVTLDGVQNFTDWTHARLTLLLCQQPFRRLWKRIAKFRLSTLREQMIHILNCEDFGFIRSGGSLMSNRGFRRDRK